MTDTLLTFGEAIAAILYEAHQPQATGLVAAIMRATGHILYLVGAFADPLCWSSRRPHVNSPQRRVISSTLATVRLLRYQRNASGVLVPSSQRCLRQRRVRQLVRRRARPQPPRLGRPSRGTRCLP